MRRNIAIWWQEGGSYWLGLLFRAILLVALGERERRYVAAVCNAAPCHEKKNAIN